jgi:hypothetical protein
MSVNLNLNRTNFQAQLRSKPLRENEVDIENAVNDLQSQISAIATAATGTFAEITNARDYHSVLRDRLRSMGKAITNKLITGGAVTVNGDTTKCDVAAGEAIVNGVGCKWTAQTSSSLTAATSCKARIDIVVINSDNTLSVVAGSEKTTGTSPDIPNIADSQLALAYLYIPDTSPVNLTGDIYSKYTQSCGTLVLDFIPNHTHYLALNATGADISFDLTEDETSLVGSMQMIVTHGSTACNMRFANTAYHINVDGSTASYMYVMPAGATKRTIFQVYNDDVNLYVMENPFYVVS